MDAPRPQRNRVHIDVWVPHDQAGARVAAAIAAGGRLVTDGHAPSWWTLADPEGNEVDVATWQELDALGCDAVQGFYITRPVPADQLVTWLGNHTTAPSSRHAAKP